MGGEGSGRRKLCAVLMMACSFGCAWTPRQREAFFLELGRASSVAVIQTVICSRIVKRFEVAGGVFEVPKGACKRRQLPSGNVEFTFEGQGRFSKGLGFATGEFRQAGLVEYQVRIVDGYIYVVPERVEVGQPELYNLSLLAGLAESLLGYVSSGVARAIDSKMNVPRTIILSMQGRQCVVEGWIPPRSIPVRCGGGSDAFYPQGGTYEALTRAPPNWNSDGVDLTAALAPVRPEPEPVPVEVPADSPPAVAVTASPAPSTPQPPLVSAAVEASAQPQLDDAHVRAFIVANNASIAEAVRHIAHPSAQNAGLFSFDIRSGNGPVEVDLQVTWDGAMTGAMYTTTVRWEFETQRHRRLVLVSDTSAERVSEGSLVELDEYFRDLLFPNLQN